MTHTPFISVISIFSNGERFLQEAIESVLQQTYPHWEFFLVDDGSTDRSTEIARQYAEQFPEKIRYLEHENHQNHGMSASRNLGLDYAQGQYVAFIDADDVWLPNKLEQQVAILEANPEAMMVYGPAQYWYSWSGEVQDENRDFLQPLTVSPNTLVKPPELLLLLLQNEGSTPSPSGILVRREAIERVGRFEKTFRTMFEDLVFYAKLYLQASVFVADTCWYLYRRHPEACVDAAVSTGRYAIARLTFLSWLESYLNKQGIHEGEIWDLLQQKLAPQQHTGLSLFEHRTQRTLHFVKGTIKDMVKQVMPFSLIRQLRSYQERWRERTPGIGRVRFGGLRRLTPISRLFGFDRGTSIDRYYIEHFLSASKPDIQGRVLEIADNFYTCKFGGDRVTQSEILYAEPGNPLATIIADLTDAPHIPSDSFDCIICTQTLLVIYDVKTVLNTLYRILKPGGVLLATFPGISQISRYDMDRWGDYWRFTSLSAQRLFEEVFPKEQITIQSFGNVLAAVAFLHGLCTDDLKSYELEYRDRDYEVSITVRAVK